MAAIFRQALSAVQANRDTALVRVFREKYEGRDIMLPVKNTATMRQYAKANNVAPPNPEKAGRRAEAGQVKRTCGANRGMCLKAKTSGATKRSHGASRCSESADDARNTAVSLNKLAN
jgi:hypothetical protein